MCHSAADTIQCKLASVHEPAFFCPPTDESFLHTKPLSYFLQHRGELYSAFTGRMTIAQLTFGEVNTGFLRPILSS